MENIPMTLGVGDGEYPNIIKSRTAAYFTKDAVGHTSADFRQLTLSERCNYLQADSIGQAGCAGVFGSTIC